MFSRHYVIGKGLGDIAARECYIYIDGRATRFKVGDGVLKYDGFPAFDDKFDDIGHSREGITRVGCKNSLMNNKPHMRSLSAQDL